MTARYEIVVTDADQPWRLRTVSGGNIGLRSETYARMIGAERAILSIARMHGYVNPQLVVNVGPAKGSRLPVEKVLTAAGAAMPHILVRYVDERTGSST